MSIEDRIEAAKKTHDAKVSDQKDRMEQAQNEAKKFFTPVYKAFLEIDEKYGTDRGLKIKVTEHSCSIRKEKGLDKLELSCFSFSKPHITIEERNDYSVTPDGGVVENRKKVDNAEEAIQIAIDYIAENIG